MRIEPGSNIHKSVVKGPAQPNARQRKTIRTTHISLIKGMNQLKFSVRAMLVPVPRSIKKKKSGGENLAA
jgi:hypothetical protein